MLSSQAGPLVGVSVPTGDKGHKNQHRGCAFVEFQHQVSVDYAINLLNQISLYGYPMKVSYMTAGSNSGSKTVNQSPVSTRAPPPPFSGANNSQNFLSFSDSPVTDARQLISPNNSRPTSSNSSNYYPPPPVSSNRDHRHGYTGRGASRGSGYYPQWLQDDTIRQIHDWRERERSRQSSSHHHHHHDHYSNGYPPSHR